MLGAFLGAGFSRWAADLPLASELFDWNVRVRGSRENRRFQLVHDEWTAWSATHPAGQAEEFIHWALSLPSKRRERVIWYISRRLSEPFLCRILGGSATFTIDDSRVRQQPGVLRAQRFLQRFLGTDVAGIVTCNYDLLVEYSLTTRHFNYGVRGERLYGRGSNPWFPSRGSHPTLQGTLPLAKLHGSLSWEGDWHYTDGRRGLSGRATIIPPRPEKEPPGELAATWDLARRILSRTTRLVVFGFAFNPYDRAVLDLLATTGTQITQVLLIDVNPRIDAAKSLWPQATIDSSGPPDADGRLAH